MNNINKINKILELHEAWADEHDALNSGEWIEEFVGELGDLQGAHLQGADLKGKNLQYIDLRGANLQGAYLYGAHLHGAHVSADLLPIIAEYF